MEELGSLWSYQESIDELKMKLQYASIELESVKMKANEQLMKHKEEVKHLVNLLKVAYQERDEARDQLQKVLNKCMPSSPSELQAVFPHRQPPEKSLLIAAKANSSITESNSLNSLSDTNNHLSHGSSPTDSFFDAVTSPEFSSINMADSGSMVLVNQPLVRDHGGSMPTRLVSSGVTKKDPATAVIDAFVKGKTLPQKGKLLQAVMDAGPLLQTLLVAGPLPRWRNPPPLQPFKIPPVSIKGYESANAIEKPAANPSSIVQKPLNSSYLEMSRGSPHMCSTSVLNFASSASAYGLLSSGCGASTQIPSGKRQRSQ